MTRVSIRAQRLILLGLVFALPTFGCNAVGFDSTRVSPKLKTIAAIGDRSMPTVSGAPGSMIAADRIDPKRVRPAEERISGRIVDPDGVPVPNARVRIAIDGVDGGQAIRDITDASGGFTLRGLQPGRSYTILAESRSGGKPLVGRGIVEAPDRGVEIALRDVALDDRDDSTSNRSVRNVSNRNRRESKDESIDDEPSGGRRPSRTDRRPAFANPDDTPDDDPAGDDHAWNNRNPRRDDFNTRTAFNETSSWSAAGSADASDDPIDRKRASTNIASTQDDDGPNPLPPALEREPERKPAPARSLANRGRNPAKSTKSRSIARPPVRAAEEDLEDDDPRGAAESREDSLADLLPKTKRENASKTNIPLNDFKPDRSYTNTLKSNRSSVRPRRSAEIARTDEIAASDDEIARKRTLPGPDARVRNQTATERLSTSVEDDSNQDRQPKKRPTWGDVESVAGLAAAPMIAAADARPKPRRSIAPKPAIERSTESNPDDIVESLGGLQPVQPRPLTPSGDPQSAAAQPPTESAPVATAPNESAPVATAPDSAAPTPNPSAATVAIDESKNPQILSTRSSDPSAPTDPASRNDASHASAEAAPKTEPVEPAAEPAPKTDPAPVAPEAAPIAPPSSPTDPAQPATNPAPIAPPASPTDPAQPSTEAAPIAPPTSPTDPAQPSTEAAPVAPPAPDASKSTTAIPAQVVPSGENKPEVAQTPVEPAPVAPPAAQSDPSVSATQPAPKTEVGQTPTVASSTIAEPARVAPPVREETKTANPTPASENPSVALERFTGKRVEFCQYDPSQRRIIDFGLRDLEGNRVRFRDLDADYILLDFWGSWCVPCLESIPHLVDLQKRYGPRLKVIGIAYETGAPADRIAAVTAAAKRLGIDYTILLA